MKNLLLKLKLKKVFKIVLDTDKENFIKKLKNNVESSDLNFFSDFFNFFPFSSKKSNMKLKGFVLENSFKVKQNISIHSFQNSIAVANGKITMKNQKLIIETVVNGFSYKMIPICLFSFFTFIIAIAALNIGNNEKSLFGLSFFMLLISFAPYLKMKYDTKKLSELIQNEISKMN